MKYLCIILWFILPAIVMAQEVKQVTKVSPYTGRVTTYHVLVSDTLIKHGSFTEVNGDKVVISGFYDHDKKDSLWIENNPRSGSPITSGRYRLGERIGLWEFYDASGTLEQKYDFDSKRLVFSKEELPMPTFHVLEGDSSLPDSINALPPLFIGGSYQYIRSLQREIMYPDMERENDIAGRVVISFRVAADGTTSDYKVAKSVSSGLDKEAMRVVKMLNTWIPAIRDGKAVDAVMYTPIAFKLQ